MNKMVAPPLKNTPIEIAQLETAQHVGDIVARGAEEGPALQNSDVAAPGPQVDVMSSAAADQTVEHSASDAALMSEWSIHLNGRFYVYRGYHYIRLADAVGYARQVSVRQSPQECGEGSVSHEWTELPSAADCKLMAEHSISFKAGIYEFSGNHYDHLKEALSYARMTGAAPGRQPGNDIE